MGVAHLVKLDAEGVLQDGRERRGVLAGHVAAILRDPDIWCPVTAVHIGQQFTEPPRHCHQPFRVGLLAYGLTTHTPKTAAQLGTLSKVIRICCDHTGFHITCGCCSSDMQ